MNDASFLQRLLEVVSRKLSDATELERLDIRNEALLFGEFRAHVSMEVEQELLRRGENSRRTPKAKRRCDVL